VCVRPTDKLSLAITIANVKYGRKEQRRAETTSARPDISMRRRIDLGDEDPNKELEDALRQLERPRKSPEAAPRGEAQPREEIEGAVRELGEQQRAAPALRPRGMRPGWVKLVLVGFPVLVIVVAAVVLTRPAPLPPPAVSAPEAVRGFWTSVIGGKYEAATVYCPDLLEKFGSRKQAAMRLKEQFSSNPPTRLAAVGEPERLPESGHLRVSYEVYLRSGTPRLGDAIVLNSGDPNMGYIIIAGL
jgi:hypothetical protein